MAAALLVLLALAGWEALVRGGVVDALLLPAPDRRRAGAVDRPLDPRRGPAGHRPARSCSGWPPRSPLGVALGVRDAPLGAACGATLRPLVIGSQAVPIPVIAPLFILVLGFGLAPKVLMVALVCFFPVDDQPLRRPARRRPGRAQAAALARRLALAAPAPAGGAERAARRPSPASRSPPPSP